MPDSVPPNPFREELGARLSPDPCTLVIFGATGDLTHRKLVPALYNLAVDGELPAQLRVVGFARREKDDAEFRAGLEEVNRKVSRQAHDPAVWDAFSAAISYHQGEFEDPGSYRSLADRLASLEAEHGAPGNRLFYLASAPDSFEPILEQLRNSGLHHARSGCWARVVVEKPFGTDLPSARQLNEFVNATFEERDTYRIDHYLGKETAQNIMVLRFANAIFEPLWNSHHIDCVQITCAENLGMSGGRGGYYDKAGALRDMVQNHLLQLLSLVAMEPPTGLGADAIRDEKIKVLRSLRPLDSAKDVAANAVRAQYTAGLVDGEPARGYLEEDRVAPGSATETYAALRLHIDNWRWSGVPFYIRVGKQLPRKATEISIHFRNPPSVLFNRQPGHAGSNVLVIRIQPDEGNSLRTLSKVPGAALRLEPVKMDFHYRTSFGQASPEAYERLLLDAMAGDATLFARRDEVEQAWQYIDSIRSAWDDPQARIPVAHYPAGSWGPEEADALVDRDGRRWRRL
ncbi:MAG TPA: glucose-6-phosphate dehydrogenase [Verrucomicrobiales bacterium]|nr:glucose-6-phosphate dehydrogenase [Verrucomicrobiales bacterium]